MSDSALKQGRKYTQPYNRAVHNSKNSLRECLVEYEKSGPEGVRLEWRTPRVARSKLALLQKN